MLSSDRLHLEGLFEATATTATGTELTGTPQGTLLITEFLSFDCGGPSFAGNLNPTSAAEWATVTSDGTGTAEGRLTLSALDTGTSVYMKWRARWDASIYGSVAPFIVATFESNNELAWLNTVVAAGAVHNDGDRRRYELFRLLVAPQSDTSSGKYSLAPLFMLDNTVDVARVVFLTDTSVGSRAIGAVRVADLRGDAVRGQLFGHAAGDWASLSADKTVTIDVIETLKTDDGALIQLNYRGLTDASKGTYTTPSYVVGLFSTGDPRYRWLNKVLAIGEGRHEVPEIVAYHFYELREDRD